MNPAGLCRNVPSINMSGFMSHNHCSILHTTTKLDTFQGCIGCRSPKRISTNQYFINISSTFLFTTRNWTECELVLMLKHCWLMVILVSYRKQILSTRLYWCLSNGLTTNLRVNHVTERLEKEFAKAMCSYKNKKEHWLLVHRFPHNTKPPSK